MRRLHCLLRCPAGASPLRTPARSVMWFSETDPKGGYQRERTEEEKREIRRGALSLSAFSREYHRLRNWVKERRQATFEVNHGAYKVFEDFSRVPDDVRPEWVVTTDADNAEGTSQASFERTPQGTAIFSGTLATEIVASGENVRTGYANVRSPGNLLLGFNVGYDIRHYNHIVVRYRGDGRTYLLNLHFPGYFDIEWHDLHYFYLFTKGGPYWQTARIPYSKFIFSAKGRIQDQQYRVGRYLKSMSVTVADRRSGPFKLELSSIGFSNDKYTHEINAYEMYETTSTSKVYK